MVAEIDLKKTTATGSVKVKENQALYDYAIMIPLLCLVVLFGIKVYLGATKFFATEEEQVLFSGLLLGSLALSLYTWLTIKHSKKLTLIRTDLTKKNNQSLIEIICKEIGLNNLKSNQHYIIATTPSNVLVGQEVTVILQQGEVWINVRLSIGMKGRLPFSFGKSKDLMIEIESRIQNHLTPRLTTPASASL